MSHVVDGELTAYADGAYPGNDPDALRISAHLSACDNCRTRLEQAHALRDRTAEILGFATPAVRTAPSFEALEAQIATSPVKPPAPRHLARTRLLELSERRAPWRVRRLQVHWSCS